jgi:hypothetical protein
VTRAQLPTAKSDIPSEILIQPSTEGPAAAVPEQVRAEVTAILENRDQIQVPETLRSPHPIVKRWIEQKRERQKVDQLSGRRSEPPIDATERRKLRILSAIFGEIEKLGHAIKELAAKSISKSERRDSTTQLHSFGAPQAGPNSTERRGETSLVESGHRHQNRP